MLKKRVIPCLDVDHGKVVKGVNFRGLREVGDPVEMATEYEAQGADEIVFLDVSASREGRKALLDAVRHTAENLFIPLTVGGGVASVADVDRLLRAGADKVGVNTGAVREPALIAAASREFGAQCVVVAIDAKRVGAIQVGRGPPALPSPTPRRPPASAGPAWEVYTHGGTRPTGLDAIAWAHEAARRGAGEILLTSMDRDGTKDGYDLALTRAASKALPIPVIASGGAGTAAHMVEALTRGGASAALAASIFHFGEVTVREVKERLAKAGVPVRLG